MKGQAPIVTARTKVTETNSAPGAFCYLQSQPPSTSTSVPETLLVNDTGTLLHKEIRGLSSIYPYYPLALSERPAAGAWPDLPRTTVSDYYNRWNTHVEFDLGVTGNVIVTGDYRYDYGFRAPLLSVQGTGANLLPALGEWSRARGATGAKLFADDTGIVIAEQSPIEGSDAFTQGVYAYDPVNTVPATVPTSPAKADGEILDDPALTADVKWTECPDVPMPTSADLITATYNTPFTSSKSAGTVTTRDLRATGVSVKQTTLTIKTFGFTTWTKTLPGINAVQSSVTLPKPWLFLPQTLTIDTELAPIGTAPAQHVVAKRSWQAWK